MYNLQLIKELCDKKNIKLSELAERIGMTPEGISHLLRKNSTKANTLVKISEVLGVTPEYFLKSGSDIDKGQFNHQAVTSTDLKDRYILVLEENIKLQKEISALQDKLAQCTGQLEQKGIHKQTG